MVAQASPRRAPVCSLVPALPRLQAEQPNFRAGTEEHDMSDPNTESEPAFHLFLDAEEASATTGALKLLLSDEAHQPKIRELARAVLAGLEQSPAEGETLTLPLAAQEMKITHTAVRLLLNDLQREQDDQRKILWQILDKLPDEHAIRAVIIE
jgi:hypothetical protein